MTPGERQSLIEGCGLFDADFYLAKYADVAASSYDPFEHYVKYGGDENRYPSEGFDPEYYVEQCAARGIVPGNALVHFLTQGRALGMFLTPVEFTLRHAGLRADELALKFEGWGRDCEFGLLQRRLGAEPHDLFRFSNPTAAMLAKLIRKGFAGVGGKCSIVLDDSQRREWFIHDQASDTLRHSNIFEDDMPRATVQKTAMLWTRLQAEKTSREVSAGQKIYVIKSSSGDLAEAAVREVAAALRSQGNGWLVWVEAGTPVGHCEVAGEGLIRARIDRLCTPGFEYRFSLVGWLAVMCQVWNALRSDRR